MKRASELFKELYDILEAQNDVKAYQEFFEMASALEYNAKYKLRNELHDLKDQVKLFHSAKLSEDMPFGQCGDHAYWRVTDGVLTIGGQGDMWEDVSVPWGRCNYHSVIILNGITSIRTEAFCGAKLQKVMIPASVKTIKECAFFDARIENLILPETLETIEDGILAGFSTVVDTLSLSVNIPNMMPFSLYNRDCETANTVRLCGELPKDLSPLAETHLFDYLPRKIFYPAKWDREGESFYEKLVAAEVDCYEKNNFDFSNGKEVFLDNLKNALIPYEI